MSKWESEGVCKLLGPYRPLDGFSLITLMAGGVQTTFTPTHSLCPFLSLQYIISKLSERSRGNKIIIIITVVCWTTLLRLFNFRGRPPLCLTGYGRARSLLSLAVFFLLWTRVSTNCPSNGCRRSITSFDHNYEQITIGTRRPINKEEHGLIGGQGGGGGSERRRIVMELESRVDEGWRALRRIAKRRRQSDDCNPVLSHFDTRTSLVPRSLDLEKS